MSISRKLQRARARAIEKPQVKRAIADARKEFIAKFGREPLEGEPLIFDPDFDTPTPYTDEKMTNMMVEAMEAAGIPALCRASPGGSLRAASSSSTMVFSISRIGFPCHFAIRSAIGLGT